VIDCQEEKRTLPGAPAVVSAFSCVAAQNPHPGARILADTLTEASTVTSLTQLHSRRTSDAVFAAIVASTPGGAMGREVSFEMELPYGSGSFQPLFTWTLFPARPCKTSKMTTKGPDWERFQTATSERRDGSRVDLMSLGVNTPRSNDMSKHIAR
jgi:hypothetical protein